MFDHYYRKDIAWGGKTLTLETGKVARQADGAVMARLAIPSCSAQRSVAVRSSPGRTSSR